MDPDANGHGDVAAALMRRAQTGDEVAFADLVRLHQRVLWSVCLRITNNENDAADALQECLVAAWRYRGQFRGEARVGTWLHRIATNSALAVARRRDRPLATEAPELSVPDGTTNFADVDLVRAALARVPAPFRASLVLREICDFTYQEIAEHQGISIQTVKSRISRGRAALQELLTAAQGS